MRNIYLTLAFFLFGFVLTAQKLPFQGYLEESGVPVNGTRTFNFELTDYGWSETIADVPIDNGIYNVVLGEITLLPDTIFANLSETPLSITVDSTNIGTVTLYKPLVSGQSLLGNEDPLIVKGPNGEIKAELNYFPTNNSGSLVINGANDSTKVILGSVAGGYEGGLFLYDSLRNSHVALRGDNEGGSLQLSKRESGSLRSAIFGRALQNRSNLQMYASNTTLDGISLMIENYITSNEISGGPLMSGDYLRSGTDWKDNEGRLLAAIGNTRDEGGSDPSGSSGYLSLWGTNSFNVELTGKRWENNDFPTLNMFGNNDDGGEFWMRNISLDVSLGDGTDNFGNIILSNTNNGGLSTDGLLLTSNLNATGGGGIEVKDSTGANTIILNGSSGNISSNRPSDGGSAVNLFQNAENGGIAVMNAIDENKLLYSASNNILEFKVAGTPNVSIDGENGKIFLPGVEAGQFNGQNGLIYATGENNTAGDNIRVGIEVIADSLGSSDGRLFVKNANSTDIITLEGSTGNVSAVEFLTTSDKRYKKNITTLDNALGNTLKLRGTSYFWKDENKPQKRQIGVVAQEVEEIYPEFVHTNDEGFKSVNYAQMTAVLIEAIKELNVKVENLEKENETLTTALKETKDLAKKINKLEKLLLEDQKVASN
ncbi:MAG: tail fiber domain-containing protein [Bacteroidota bacterium]